jgi:hypothetical protein
LKYAAQWVFSNDGKKAVCLRDYARYSDYAQQWCLFGGGIYTPFVQSYGLVPTAIELRFDANQHDPLTTEKTWFGYPAGAHRRNSDHTDADGVWGIYNSPLAVGYDVNNELSYCFLLHLYEPVSVDPLGTQPYVSSFIFASAYNFAPNNHDGATRFSAKFALDSYNRDPQVGWPNVLDIRDRVVFAFGAIQSQTLLIGDGGLYYPRRNPAFRLDWLNTPEPVAVVRLWRNGAELNRQVVGNTCFVAYDWFNFCWSSASLGAFLTMGTILELSANRFALPSYAVSRSGDWVASYTVIPQPGVARVLESILNDCCGVINDDACIPTAWTGTGDVPALQENTADTVGSWMGSSFASSAQLASMTHTEGASPRFLYARSV